MKKITKEPSMNKELREALLYLEDNQWVKALLRKEDKTKEEVEKLEKEYPKYKEMQKIIRQEVDRLISD